MIFYIKLNEKQTRKQLIDTLLFEADWDANDHTQVVEEYVVDVTAGNQVKELCYKCNSD